MGGKKQGPFDFNYYKNAALAGGVCCSITHGAACPVDVVKTRMQLQPEVYNKGMIGGFRQVIQNEGAMALTTGLGATAGGYFFQGFFKFGGVEFFKVNLANKFGEQKAWENRTAIYLGSAASAEFIADIFLCPFEAARIGAVQNPELGGLVSAGSHILRNKGVLNGLYAGFGPMLFKQVPYTMAKFAVQGAAAEKIATAGGIDLASPQTAEGTKLGVSLSSGVIAGVAAAIISHPADTLLSLVNKPGMGGDGPVFSRLKNIALEVGPAKLCLNGLPARCVMIGGLTAGQFAVFDKIMFAFGAEKFHFHDPNEEKESPKDAFHRKASQRNMNQ